MSFAEADDKSATPNGPGVYIFRNVFDLRDTTFTWIAKDANAAAKRSPSRLCGDHGSPTWEPLFFYLNTVIGQDAAYRNVYGEGIAQATKGTKRRVLDNIFVQVDGQPGMVFPNVKDDLQVDGNLLWSLNANTSVDIFKKFRSSKQFDDSKASYAPGFGVHDVFADPALVTLDATSTLDVRLKRSSPAIDAGVAIPADWPDSMATLDKGAPDIGAIPSGGTMISVGPAAAPKP